MNSKILIGVSAAVVIFGGGVWQWRHKLIKPELARSRVLTVQEGPVEETVEATGSVSPLNRVEIKPPIPGRIEKLIVDEGDTVKAGQIVAWMSSSDRAAILDAARAQGPKEYKKWEDAYKPTPIIAPLSGVIILRNVVVGQTVDSGVVIYAMSDNLIVIAQVDESDIGRVKVDMSVRITLDAYPNRSVEGKVFEVLYEGKNVSNVIQYGVKIRLESVPSYFRSQMTANVGFIISRKEHVILLPASAVHETASGIKQVFVPGPDGLPETREVKTGVESGETVEIVSGLKPGEKVLLIQGKYVPQKGPQSSPLTFGGKKSGSDGFGQAPKPKRSQ